MKYGLSVSDGNGLRRSWTCYAWDIKGSYIVMSSDEDGKYGTVYHLPEGWIMSTTKLEE